MRRRAPLANTCYLLVHFLCVGNSSPGFDSRARAQNELDTLPCQDPPYLGSLLPTSSKGPTEKQILPQLAPGRHRPHHLYYPIPHAIHLIV